MYKVISWTLLVLVVFVIANYSGGNSPKTFNVSINEEGFSPEVLNIPLGSTVVWTNDGQKAHWPASNYHPTHTLYPEEGGCLGSKFDACKGLLNGETFTFKFDKEGNWTVHDHLFPGLTMVVNVYTSEDLSKKSNNTLSTSDVSPEEFRNLNGGEQLELIKKIARDNPKEAWEYVKKAFIVNGQVVGNAHEFAHIIGNESYQKSGLDGIVICDRNFAFGCFHGVTEAMLLKEGTNRIKDIEIGCIKLFPPSESEDYSGCIHGTGHGIYTWEDGDLKKSLLDCDIISEPYRQYCYDGVFMENSTSHHVASLDNDNLWKLCSDLDQKYHNNCARYQTTIFMSMNTGLDSLEKTGRDCSLGPTKEMRDTCYMSLGFYVSQTAVGNIMDITKKCNNMPSKEGVEMCINGAAIESVFQRYSGFERNSINLCHSLTEPMKSSCLNSVNRMLQ